LHKEAEAGFSALESGLTVRRSRRERLRFMTLTSSPESLGRSLELERALKSGLWSYMLSPP
jgi:hypothetical protein